MNEFWYRLFDNPDALYVLIALVAIIAGAIVIIVIAKFLIDHRERMAMIERGIHPDYPLIDVEVDQHPIKSGPSKPV